ncbi:serine hydrolase [bacterium]|nr:serine hydrolase [bacterium]
MKNQLILHLSESRAHQALKSGIQRGGYAVLQLMLKDLEGMVFPQLMEENVLNPLGMEQSTFGQPLPQKYKEQAAVGHLRTGQPVPGKWHNYPEMAASGLWTNPSDLSSFAAAVMKTAMGKRRDLISIEKGRSMLTPQIEDRGLGVVLQGEGDNLNFHLEGENKGYACYMVAYPARGEGAIVMTNGDNGAYLIEEILRGISEVYDWPHFETEIKKLYRLKTGILDQYVGRYQMTPDYILTVTYEDYYLVVQVPGQKRTKFYVENRTTFFSRSPFTKIRFLRNAQGRVDRLAWKRDDQWREAKKIE